MSETRVNVRVNDFDLETLDDVGASVFTEAAGNRSEIARRIWTDWRRQRDEEGGKSAKARRHLDAVHQDILATRVTVEQMAARLAAIEANLTDALRTTMTTTNG